MDPSVYIGAAILVVFLIVLATKFFGSKTNKENNEVRRPRAAPVPRDEAPPAAARRRGARQRMGRRTNLEDDSDEEEESLFNDIDMPEGKVGAKKLRKLQDKAEKKQMREEMEREREEKKKRDALLEKERKRDEERTKKRDEELAEEDKIRQEEEQQREHEEYLRLKESFIVEEEGLDESNVIQDSQTLLQEFVDYIKQMKVVMLEDLAAHFKIKTQDAIDRVTELQSMGRLTGVIDDRGKFIYITMEELEAVAKFIKQRGRVSITELAESSNKLINLNPDKDIVQKTMLSGGIVEETEVTT